MDTILRLRVFRRLDNRAAGLSDASARALELHNRRREALHDVFDDEPSFKVTEWGIPTIPRLMSGLN